VTFSMRRGTFDPDLKEALRRALNKEIRSLLPTQRYVRGAFCGGTLCQEAIEILSTRVSPIYSNTHAPAVTEMSDPLRSVGHTLVDLGDDLFTVGRPHPMIDPSLRNARILDEAKDKETAIVLFDLVLGYGSHADPAKELAVTLEKAAKIANEDGRKLLFVGSITGTQGDYQDLERQRIRLQESGALLLPSNAQAAMFAALLTERLEGTK